MDDGTMTVGAALGRAANELQTGASATALSQTPLGTTRSDAAMAAAARGAVFTEALLAAVHARLAELKIVAHG